MEQRPLRVLLADDEISLRDPLAKQLRQGYGYEVDTAADGQELLTQLEEARGRYDVALIDDLLVPNLGQEPEPLGVVLTKEIKERYPELEVILFTGWGMKSQEGLEALRAGAYRYLSKPFNPDELGMLIQMAAEHSHLKSIAREKQILEQLMKTSPVLLSGRGLSEVLAIILQGVQAIGFDRVCLYLLSEDGQTLVGQAQVNMGTGFVGHERLVSTDDYMQILLADPRPHVFEREDNKPLPFEQELGRETVNQWACVPLILQGEVIGKLSIDNKFSQRPIVEAELGPVALFASQAAAAIENTRLRDKERKATERAERRALNLKTVQELSTNISSLMELDKILETTCQAAVDLFGVDHSGLVRFEEPDYERGWVVAEYPDLGALGKEIPIHGVPIEEHLIESRQPLVIPNVSDETSLGPVGDIFDEFDLRSILIVPVIVKGRTLGSFSLDAVHRSRDFTEEEVELFQVFAAQVAVALENAQLFEELGEQKDHLARLIASSPNAVIAIDREGNVNNFSEQAQEILNYQLNEVLGKPVTTVYGDEQEAREVSRLLYKAPDGRLVNHETSVLSKEGERIPIRLAATQLVDAQGERIGSVGYFEDLRSIKTTERRWELLLRASNTVAQAKNPTDGLQSLAEMLVTFLDISFCQCFLLDESQHSLIAQAVYPTLARNERLEWSPEHEELITIAQWPDIAEVLAAGDAKVLCLENKRHRQFLTEWSHKLNLKQDIQSLLLIPLKTRERIVGLLGLAELRSWVQASLSKEKQDLAMAIADQTAVLIDRIRLYEIMERHRQLLIALDQASRRIRPEKETFKLVREIVCLAADLVGCSAGGLYINHPQLEELELIVTYDLSPQLIGTRLPHAEGLVGLVARTGQPQIIYDYSNWPDRENIFETYHLKTIVGVPLKQAGEVEAVLFVADQTGLRQFDSTDLEILESFAVQASIALQTSWLLSQEQRRFRPLAILHKVSDYIQAARDLDKILHCVLTGITAGYGLGFNRSALFLLDEGKENLMGRLGIGHLDEVKAQEDWERDEEQEGLLDFGRYIIALEQNTLPPTPIDAQIRRLQLPVKSTNLDIFSQVILKGQYILVTPDELGKLSGSFIEAFEPALPLIVVPLLARDQVIGLLVADNKFTQSPITPEDIESLLTFANTAAIVIDNVQLYHETEVERERLRSFYKASNAVVSSQNPEQVLQTIVDRACVAASASRVNLLIIDQKAQPRYVITGGRKEGLDLRRVFRSDGVSMQVMQTSKPSIVIDTSHPLPSRAKRSEFWHKVGAALCLPVSLEGKSIGVMWFSYDHPRLFSEFEVEAFQLYVNQAAIAYENARRIKELEYIRRAAEALAGAAGLPQVLKQIVQSACEVLQADSAAILSYDTSRDLFMQDSSVATGMRAKGWKQFWKEHSRRYQTAQTIMEQGWLGVENVDDERQYPFLGMSTRKLLRRIGAHGFQGIALAVGNEKLGVLYVNYNHPRGFSDEEREIACTFANHAALALKKAKLLDQVSKAHNAARVVAEVTLLEDLQNTLTLLVQGAQAALGCDATVLRTYDQELGKLSQPPIVAGVHYPERAAHSSQLPPDSFIFTLLERSEPYIAENVPTDPLLGKRRFAIDEKIESCIAMPLQVGDSKVGYMFINYRRPHHFTDDELTDIKLFANQAAVAIRNAQLYEEAQKRAEALEALYEAGRAITFSLDSVEILNRLIEYAQRLTRYRNQEINFACIGLVEGLRGRIVVTYPHERLLRAQAIFGDEIDLTKKNGRIGIIGRVIKTGEPQRVYDVSTDPDYLPCNSDTHSELAVPIKFEDKVIGVINVEHPECNAFDEEDQQTLESLATQAAIAIQNARQFQELEMNKGLLAARTAIAWTGMASATWQHGIKKNTRIIEDLIKLLYLDLDAGEPFSKLKGRLADIKRAVDKIKFKQITTPLSAEAGIESVSIHELLKEWREQIRWDQEEYESLGWRLNLFPHESPVVRANPQWVKLAFEILVENAVKAMTTSSVKILDISTQRVDNRVEIAISDTGPGIPPDIRTRLFKEVIKRSEHGGAGIGLLLAQMIVQVYSGDIHIVSSNPAGTTMVIWLPLETK